MAQRDEVATRAHNDGEQLAESSAEPAREHWKGCSFCEETSPFVLICDTCPAQIGVDSGGRVHDGCVEHHFYQHCGGTLRPQHTASIRRARSAQADRDLAAVCGFMDAIFERAAPVRRLPIGVCCGCGGAGVLRCSACQSVFGCGPDHKNCRAAHRCERPGVSEARNLFLRSREQLFIVLEIVSPRRETVLPWSRPASRGPTDGLDLL